MANWTDEAKEKARETRRANKAAKAAAAAAREAELQALREEVERLRAGTPTVVAALAVISDQKGLLTDKAAQLFKAHADNLTLSNGLSAARDEIGDLVMIVADRDAQIARLRLESDEMQDELDAASIYAGELKEKLDRRSPAGGVSASTVTMAINILRTASDTLALALEDDGQTEDDDTQNPTRPITQWSAAEYTWAATDNPERVRPPAQLTPFVTRPSEAAALVAALEVAEEITEIEDEQILEAVMEASDYLLDGPTAHSSTAPVDQGVPDELEERAEEDLSAHPNLVSAAPPPLEERTMLELNRLAIELGISPSGNKPHLVRLLNEAAGEEKQ